MLGSADEEEAVRAAGEHPRRTRGCGLNRGLTRESRALTNGQYVEGMRGRPSGPAAVNSAVLPTANHSEQAPYPRESCRVIVQVRSRSKLHQASLTLTRILLMYRANLLVATAGQGIWREAKPAARLAMRPVSARLRQNAGASFVRRTRYSVRLDSQWPLLGTQWHPPASGHSHQAGLPCKAEDHARADTTIA